MTFRPPTWDATHRSFVLSSDYAEGRGGSVPLADVAPRCFSCGKTRPASAASFMGRGKGTGVVWRAVVLPSDPDRGQLRWLTDQGAFMVVPVCAKCAAMGTLPIDFMDWDLDLQRRKEEFDAQEKADVEIERTREGVR